MEVKATVLSENTVYGLGGLAEHGWAVWLETPSGNWLFDTGQGKVLLHNATHFGIDLPTVRAILISHRHYDHTGGLLRALRLARGGVDRTGVPVHAHFDLFKETYAMPKGKKPRHVGIPFSRVALEGTGAIFYLTHEWLEIEEGIYMTGEVPRRTDFERGDPDLKHFDADGELVPDPMVDDQALIIETNQGLFVVLGCSHAGVVNILNHITARTGRSRFHTVIGGTHLGPANDEQIAKTLEALRGFEIERIGASHCTGTKVAAQLAGTFGDRFFYCTVGTQVEV